MARGQDSGEPSINNDERPTLATDYDSDEDPNDQSDYELEDDIDPTDLEGYGDDPNPMPLGVDSRNNPYRRYNKRRIHLHYKRALDPDSFTYFRPRSAVGRRTSVLSFVENAGSLSSSPTDLSPAQADGQNGHSMEEEIDWAEEEGDILNGGNAEIDSRCDCPEDKEYDTAVDAPRFQIDWAEEEDNIQNNGNDVADSDDDVFEAEENDEAADPPYVLLAKTFGDFRARLNKLLPELPEQSQKELNPPTVEDPSTPAPSSLAAFETFRSNVMSILLRISAGLKTYTYRSNVLAETRIKRRTDSIESWRLERARLRAEREALYKDIVGTEE